MKGTEAGFIGVAGKRCDRRAGIKQWSTSARSFKVSFHHVLPGHAVGVEEGAIERDAVAHHVDKLLARVVEWWQPYGAIRISPCLLHFCCRETARRVGRGRRAVEQMRCAEAPLLECRGMHNAIALIGPSRNAPRGSAHTRGANAPRASASPSAERIPHRSRSFNRLWHSGRSRNAHRIECTTR